MVYFGPLSSFSRERSSAEQTWKVGRSALFALGKLQRGGPALGGWSNLGANSTHVALLQAFCFHPAVDGVLFASMENFIYCWENSSFDAMLRSHVVPWQNLKVKRFFHFCLVYFVLFTFRASAFARYKICTTAVEPCNELIIRLADGPIVAFCLIGCLSFCMHVAVEFITHLHLFLYIYIYIILMHLGLLRFYLHV